MSLFDALVRMGGFESSSPPSQKKHMLQTTTTTTTTATPTPTTTTNANNRQTVLFMRDFCVPPSINSAADILTAAQVLAPSGLVLNLYDSNTSSVLQSNLLMGEIQQLQRQRKIRVVDTNVKKQGGNHTSKAIFFRAWPELELDVDADIKQMWHLLGKNKSLIASSNTHSIHSSNSNNYNRVVNMKTGCFHQPIRSKIVGCYKKNR